MMDMLDMLEFWIWEHATKHGMTKVLKRIKTSFSQTSLPNSWMSALFLRQIKDEWGKTDNKITSKDLNSVRQSLTSTFKLYRKELKKIIRTSDLIQLDLYCKAAFLVMRSNGCDTRVKKQARDELFPVWNNFLWTKTQGSFGLKDDLFLEEIKQFYSEIRFKLGQTNHEKDILQTFGTMMNKHFPSLIAFMQRLKLSMLERIQLKKKEINTKLNFVHVRLNSELLNEVVILNLWDDVQRKKIQEKALKFLKEKRKLSISRTNTSNNTNNECNVFALPLPDPSFENIDTQLYPQCFETNPFMPSCIFMNDQHEARLIDKTTPRNCDGKPFEPHWFSDTNSHVTKAEKQSDFDCVGTNGRTKSTTTRSPGRFKSIAFSGLAPNNHLPTTDNGITPKESVADDKIPINSFPIPFTNVGRVQSWIDNHDPASPSSVENGSVCDVNCQFVSSSKTGGNSSKEIFETKFAKTSETELVLSVMNESSLRNQKAKTKRKQTDHESESPKNVSLSECELAYSPMLRVEESDVEAVSSTTTSSNTKIQTTFTPWKYLTEQAKLMKMEVHEDSGQPAAVLKENLQSESSGSDDCFPRLRSQARKCNNVKLGKVRTSTRLKRKDYQKPVCSANLSTPASPKNRSANKRKRTFRIESESDFKLSKAKQTTQQQAESQLGGTPPIEEPSSNYKTPIQQEKDILFVNELETSLRKAAIKRKLYEDEIIVDTPKSKRIPLDFDIPNGRRVLSNVLDVLKKHSEKLRKKDRFAAGHCEELNRCIKDVFFSHQRVKQNVTDGHLDPELAYRVKHSATNILHQIQHEK